MFEDQEAEGSTIDLFATPRRRMAPAAWAMTDLIFQLLIVFVLGVSMRSAVETPAEADVSWFEGPATPRYGKEITFRIFQIVATEGEGYRMVIDSNPEVSERRQLEVGDREQMIETVLLWEEDLKQLADQHPEYAIRRTLISPRNGTYESVFRNFADLQQQSGSVWLAGMYDSTTPKRGAETVAGAF